MNRLGPKNPILFRILIIIGVIASIIGIIVLIIVKLGNSNALNYDLGEKDSNKIYNDIIIKSYKEYEEVVKDYDIDSDLGPQDFEDNYYLVSFQEFDSCSEVKRKQVGNVEVNKDDNYIKLYGKLEDIFGDNGVISVVIGNIKNKDELHIDLWIMSCRVLKRNMEFAMMDKLVEKAKEKKIKTIYGYYYPTLKNKMVNNFYNLQGFEEVSCDEQGNKVYKLDISKGYTNKNNVIEVDE